MGNLLMVSVIWKKRAFPVYWQFLEKAGSSNLTEQIAVIRFTEFRRDFKDLFKPKWNRGNVQGL
jgi:hypothetical protein